jgi:FtsP/CotA-like multicopper oxidase with cupredoxin domain
MPLARAISRRRFLAGAGTAAAAASAGLPEAVAAETAPDGFRIIRALDSGYDGTIPGPTLRVKQGEELRLRLVNALTESTTIHWRGVRVPNPMDGVPVLSQAAIAPGASFDYRFRLPDAGTFGYHAPLAGQIDHGLYGALVVEEAQPVAVDRDIALVLGMPDESGNGPPRVNGALRPDIPVKPGERLRLRLINASAARAHAVQLEGQACWVMAIDGQPAEPFRARDTRIGLPPGGRADLFVDTLGEAGAITPILAGVREMQPIARLVYESGNSPAPARRPDPLPLPSNPLPARIDLKGSLRVDWTLASGKPFDPAVAPLFTVKRGRAVTLAIRNPRGQAQAVHLHGHACRLLDRLDDGWAPYWLDTLVIGAPVERVAFVADNPGKWLLEYRTLEQRDSGGAAWFAVT